VTPAENYPVQLITDKINTNVSIRCILAAPGFRTCVVHRQKTAIGSCKVLAGRNVENKEWMLRFFIGVKNLCY
jgi:hypothetical protein